MTRWAVLFPVGTSKGTRQSGGPDTTALLLHGVNAATTYTVTDVRSGAVVGTYTGAQLAAGLTVSLPPASATVLSVTPN